MTTLKRQKQKEEPQYIGLTGDEEYIKFKKSLVYESYFCKVITGIVGCFIVLLTVIPLNTSNLIIGRMQEESNWHVLKC